MTLIRKVQKVLKPSNLVDTVSLTQGQILQKYDLVLLYGLCKPYKVLRKNAQPPFFFIRSIHPRNIMNSLI